MKNLLSTSVAYAGVILSIALPAHAGEPAKGISLLEPAPAADPFERAIRPMITPTLFDLAVPRTQLHPLFMQHKLPNSVRTTLGDLALGGDIQVYALQLEWALSDRFSLVAAKDGYVNLDPDNLLSDKDGWANLSAGFKYAFLYRPEDALAAAFSLQIEAPTGNRSVFQGEGDGVAIPSISMLKLWDRLQFAQSLGFQFPFDTSAESIMLNYNAHFSYALTDRFFPLVEMSYRGVLDEGDGGRRFNDHVNGLVPAVTTFEGPDLINLGAANGDVNESFVSMALGFRYRLNDNVDLGAAYEIPLTRQSESLTHSRITVDAVIRF